MAPHLTIKELDQMREMLGKGNTPIQIHAWLEKARGRKNILAPSLENVRKMLKGKSYKCGALETRGAKRVLTRKQVLKLNGVRKHLLKKADSHDKVTWTHVLRKGRMAMKVTEKTLARNFQEEGLDVKWRPARDSQDLTTKDKKERQGITGRWRFLPHDYFLEKVDAIIDNKKFKVPTHYRAFRFVKKSRVKGHLRTRGEGKKSFCRKPNSRKNRVNPGGAVNICAAIINGKLRFWHDLGTKWNGQVAADLFRGPLYSALKKYRGRKDKYLVAEDNDPSGYKSKKACAAKAEIGITTMEWPRYSPDLNPLDFSIWHEVEEKVLSKLKGPISTKAFGKRLEKAAKAIPHDQIKRAVLQIREKAKAIYAAGGGLIEQD